MPIRIRWTSKDYFGETLILLALSGMFQLFFIFIGQYVLAMGNHVILILIPIGVWVATFFASLVIFESYAQVERRQRLRSRFSKKVKKDSTLDKFLKFSLTKPLLIVFLVFNCFFFSTFFISTSFLENSMAFLTAEIISAISCLLIANLVEKKYGRIQRY